MIRFLRNPIVIYGLALAILVIALQSLQYFYWVKTISTEWYIVILAIGFTVLGVWVGSKIFKDKSSARSGTNEKAIRALGISPRELDVLAEMAKGSSNEEIAERLNISVSTVKTHVSNILVKLESDNRVKAVTKAQSLHIVQR